jgi:aspartyl-tRNA(Asn)/glutamyl-tRNA(Gln) amidotransferase subunit A
MLNQSLRELNQALEQKKISCVELTQFYLNRIKRHNHSLNCFTQVCEDSALAQAKAADQRRQQGTHTPLTGIPLAHKDNFCTQGVLTTCGSKMLENFVSPYDATIVEQLAQAGAVMLGKLNMDEFAMGSTTANSAFGKSLNPWDTNKTPGGSSGGSAAAVAARLTPLASGSDTGGSIRQPAALCGLTGLKPTYGRVSRWGMVAFASSLDQAGPLACSMEDLALMLQYMAGHDPKDSTSVNRPVDDYLSALDTSPETLTIGLPDEYFDKLDNDNIAKALEAQIEVLTQQGHQFKRISLPHTARAKATYYTIAPAECSANLARFDGVRYGYRCDNPQSLSDLYQRSRSEAFGNEVKRRILIGTHVLSSGYYEAYYKKAQRVRRLIQNDFTQAFEEVDLILTPTTPTTAFNFAPTNGKPTTIYNSDIFTLSVNLAGLPACSLPIGMVDGLPIGGQLIAPHFEEARLISLGHQYQQQTDWHRAMPSAFND